MLPSDGLIGAFLASPTVPSAIELLNAVDSAMERMKEFKKNAEEAVVEYIEREGAFAVGDRVFCVGKATSESATMPPSDGFDFLLDQCGGDLSAVKGLLSSNCFKPGAVEKQCGTEARKKLFVKVVRTVLDEKEGTERIMKKLVRTERRFLPHIPVRGEVVDETGGE